jgi:tetratricopeptide (TPR) repeat protein
MLAGLILSATCVIGIDRSIAAPPEEVEKGIAEARSGRFDSAIKIWTKVIKKRPRCYAAHVDRGAAYMRTGHILRGVMDWNRARYLSPMYAYGVYFSDFITEASRNKDVLNFAASLELEPDHVASVLMMGATFLDVGRKDKAAQLFRNSVDLTKNPLLKNDFEYWAASIESSPGEE